MVEDIGGEKLTVNKAEWATNSKRSSTKICNDGGSMIYS